MNSKSIFSLLVLLVVLLSVNMVSASENMTHDDVAQAVPENSILSESDDEVLYDDEPAVSGYSSAPELEVNIEPDTNKAKKGDMVTWTVTVKSVGGTLHNVGVNVDFPDGLRYVDSHPDAGSYNPDSGLWNVGDLKDSDVKSLKIRTEVLNKNTQYAYVGAYAESEVGDVSASAQARVDVAPENPYIVTNPEQRQHDRHDGHYLSSHQSGYRALTKSMDDNSAEAKMEMKPVAGNPIVILILALVAMIGVGFKRH